MELIFFLLRSSRRMMLGIVLASLLGGALGALLIAVVNKALEPNSHNLSLLLGGFAAVAIGKIGLQYVTQVALVKFAQDTVLRLTRELCGKVLHTPFEKIEALGSPKLLATLTEDVAVLSAAVQAIPTLAANFAVVAGCAIYLLWLSWPVFLLCIVMVSIGVTGYRVLNTRAFAAILAAREGRDRLLADYRGLIEGIKELKLHRARREQYVRDAIDTTTEFMRKQNLHATTQYLLADAWSQLLFFGLLGMLLFVAPSITSLSREALTGYVFASLYMMTPVWALVGTVPTFMRGRASLAKIRELGQSLQASEFSESDRATVTGRERDKSSTKMIVELEGVTYTYPAPSAEDRGFVLGPIDLRLEGGELLFLTGGNGSGKSTLVKLITGLYVPQAGSIRVNGRTLSPADFSSYRENFTAVFADFHLFQKLFGLEAEQRETEIDQFLKLLRLDSKVQVRNGQFSTIALSTGQRKRLALLTAFLENRPIYVFDEWAADQDPGYKEVFYSRLLPDLKQRGKCVVVVTHDDRYFSLGDRVLKLEDGRITEVTGATHGQHSRHAGVAL